MVVQAGGLNGERFRLEEVWVSEAPAVSGRGTARLIADLGIAEPSPLEIRKARITIGRQVDVHNPLGHPIRHNDLAFSESDDLGRTVSRSQAHIEVDGRRKEYRLFHDGGSSPTGVLRDGRLIDITRNPRGLLLTSGDVLYFGKARVRFEVSD